MTHSKLDVNIREIKGNSVRKLRRKNILPAVIYSKNIESICIELPIDVFIKVFKVAGKTHVIDINIENKKYSTIVHDIDVDPIMGYPRHVDFLAVDLKTEISTQVPVVLVGEPRGVKENGLVLVQTIKELEVLCLPDNIPSSIEIDVTNLLDVGDHISVENITSNKDYKLIDDEHTSIASLVAQSVEEEIAEITEETAEEVSQDSNKPNE
jgi:large subunit ribosomal protein L25